MLNADSYYEKYRRLDAEVEHIEPALMVIDVSCVHAMDVAIARKIPYVLSAPYLPSTACSMFKVKLPGAQAAGTAVAAADGSGREPAVEPGGPASTDRPKRRTSDANATDTNRRSSPTALRLAATSRLRLYIGTLRSPTGRTTVQRTLRRK
jgi:hypothetical protein